MCAKKSKAGNPSFEENIKQLESLVASLEQGEVPLEALLDKYEQGSLLVKQCQEQLAFAQLKIQQLKAGSETELIPFDA